MQILRNPVPGSDDEQECVGRVVQERSENDINSSDEEAASVSDQSQSNNTSDNEAPESEDEPFGFLKYYHGREWSEVEHLLQVPGESEKEDEDDEEDDAPSQISIDSDDPLAEDIHDLVNVLDNLIRSQSDEDGEENPVVDFLNIDVFKNGTVLAEVQDWSWEAEELLNDDSFETIEIDIINTSSN